MCVMIRNGYARHLQAEAERSRLTEHWQGYPEPVRQLLQAISREYGLAVVRRATEALVEYAASSEAAEEGQGAGLSRDWKRMRHQGSDLKGKYSSFPLQADSQSLLPLGQYLVVDTDYEMIHLLQQGGLFLQSMRCNDVALAMILPLLHAWPAPANYQTLYESLCATSWEGTFREFRRSLLHLLNECTQRLSSLGMEVIIVDGSSLQLVPFT